MVKKSADEAVVGVRISLDQIYQAQLQMHDDLLALNGQVKSTNELMREKLDEHTNRLAKVEVRTDSQDKKLELHDSFNNKVLGALAVLGTFSTVFAAAIWNFLFNR